MRFFLFTVLLLVAGCTGLSPNEELPSPRPLGRHLPTFQASEADNQDRPTLVYPIDDLTLHQALSLSLLHNPQLEAHAWRLRAEEAAILQNRLSPNPVLRLRVENFGGDDALREFDGAVSTLRISQAIELGEKRLKRTRLAQQEYALAAWDYETQRLQVIAQTGHRYVQGLAAQHRVRLAERSLSLAKNMFAIVNTRVDRGVIPTVERDKALVQVTARKIDLEKQTRKLASQRQRLAAMWAATTDHFETFDGDLYALSDVPTFESLKQQIEQNPDLARWTVEIATRQAAVQLADSDAIPNFTLGGGWRRFNATDNHAFVFELGIPLPIIDRNQGEKRHTRFHLLQAKALQRHAQSTAHAALHQMYQTLRAAHYTVIQLRDQSLPAARTAFSTAQKAFEQGVTDYLNVLDAERTLIVTEYDMIAALAEYHKTLLSLEAFLGTSLQIDD